MVTKPSDLRTEVTVSPEVPVAGEPFTAALKIENRFDQPVELLNIDLILPTDLRSYQPDEEAEKDLKGLAVAEEESPTPPKARRRPGSPRNFELRPWAQQQHPMQRVSAMEVFYPNEVDEGQTGSQTLQPGSSTIRYFPIITRAWLLSTSRRHKLDVSIAYKLGDVQHYESVPLQFEVRPALRAVIVGAIIGSAIGWLARELMTDGLNPTSLIQLILAGLLSSIGVIFVSRKTGVQSLPISVEDFLGGILTGFVIGYFGTGYFNTLLPQDFQASSPTPTLTPTPTATT